MRLTRRTVAMAVGGVALAPFANARAASGKAVVPFVLRRDQALTAVRMNGKGPFWFVIDMGAQGYAVDDRTAKAAGLTVLGSDKIQGVSGTALVNYYQVDKVFIAGGVVDEHVIAAGLVGSNVGAGEGLIPVSSEAVIAFRFEADHGEMTVAYHPPEKLDGYRRIATHRLRASGLSSHAGSDADTDPRAIVTGLLDGRRVTLFVDTGAAGSIVLFPEYVREHGLWDKYPRHLDGKAQGVSGSASLRQVRGDKLQFDQFAFDRPLVEMIDPRAPSSGRQGADGLLGLELLRRIDFVIDPYASTLWMKANGQMDDVYRYDRAGLELAWKDKSVTVVKVRADSPAAALDIRPGDVIRGFSGEDPSFDGLRWALMGKPDTRIQMLVARDGKDRTLELTLRDAI